MIEFDRSQLNLFAKSFSNLEDRKKLLGQFQQMFELQQLNMEYFQQFLVHLNLLFSLLNPFRFACRFQV